VAVAAPRPRRDWAYIGLLAFTALLFFRPQDQLRALRPLHLAELSAIGALIAMVVGRLGRGLPVTRVTPELVGVVALGAVILATAPFSIWMGGAISTFTELYMKVVLIFILMINTLVHPKRIERFAWLMVLASGYIGLRAVFDYARGMNLVENGRVQGAVGGMFRNPNDLALNMVAVLPLALCLMFRRTSLMWRLVAAGCAGLMFLTIVASHSRSGSLGLAAAILMLAAMLLKRRPGLVAAGALAVVLALPMLPSSYWARLSSITDGSRDETGSRQARSTLLWEAYYAFLDHPITGVGAGQFQNYKPEGRVEAWRETHNVFLQVASELGIAGLIAFTFLVWCGFEATRKSRALLRRTAPGARRRGEEPSPDVLTADERDLLNSHTAGIAASLAGWLVCALFASVAYHWTFYYLLALALAPREYLVNRLAATRTVRRRSSLAASVAEARA
jgi:O-antigen ligase